jgi:hypothetical protein
MRDSFISLSVLKGYLNNSTSHGIKPGSSVGLATGYGLDGPRIESRWGRDFPHLSRRALGPTHPLVQLGIRSFPGV